MALNFAGWLQKNFRNQPWSASSLVPRLEEWMPEVYAISLSRLILFVLVSLTLHGYFCYLCTYCAQIQQAFADGKLEASVRARILLSFFALSPGALASLAPPLHALLDWVDAEELDHWVLLSGGLLRSVVGKSNGETSERSASAAFLTAKVQDIVDAVLHAETGVAQNAGHDSRALEEAQSLRMAARVGSAPYERAVLGPPLSPSEAAALSANAHFSASAKASTLDWSLKRRFSNVNDSSYSIKDDFGGNISGVRKSSTSVAAADHSTTNAGDQKRARVDGGAEALATAAVELWTPSDKVLSVLGEHTNLLTRDVNLAIEQLLALTTGGSESAATGMTTAQPAAKYKVHECITSDGTAKESVYVLLDFSARTWKKTKKVKKLKKE